MCGGYRGESSVSSGVIALYICVHFYAASARTFTCIHLIPRFVYCRAVVCVFLFGLVCYFHSTGGDMHGKVGINVVCAMWVSVVRGHFAAALHFPSVSHNSLSGCPLCHVYSIFHAYSALLRPSSLLTRSLQAVSFSPSSSYSPLHLLPLRFSRSQLVLALSSHSACSYTTRRTCSFAQSSSGPRIRTA